MIGLCLSDTINIIFFFITNSLHDLFFEAKKSSCHRHCTCAVVMSNATTDVCTVCFRRRSAILIGNRLLLYIPRYVIWRLRALDHCFCSATNGSRFSSTLMAFRHVGSVKCTKLFWLTRISNWVEARDSWTGHPYGIWMRIMVQKLTSVCSCLYWKKSCYQAGFSQLSYMLYYHGTVWDPCSKPEKI